jgi:hypothetical protein
MKDGNAQWGRRNHIEEPTLRIYQLRKLDPQTPWKSQSPTPMIKLGNSINFFTKLYYQPLYRFGDFKFNLLSES